MGNMLEHRNLIVAIALSLAVLVGFQYFYEIPRAERQKAEAARQGAATTQETATPAPTVSTAGGSAKTVPPGAAPAAATPGAAVEAADRAAALSATARVPILSPRVHGSLPVVGRRIDDLVLSDYKVSLDKNSPDITLFSPQGAPKPYYASFGWASGDADLKLPDDDTVWQVNGSQLAPGHPVTLTWDNGQGLVFSRVVAVDENYMFTVTQRVENRGDKEVTLSPWGLISRTDTPKTLGFYILHEGPIGVLEDNSLKEIKYKDLEVGSTNDKSFASTKGWLGITDKYWLAALVPDQNPGFTGSFRKLLIQNRDRYQIDYLSSPVTVPAGGSVESASRLFAGAKEVKLLDAYEKHLGIPLFDRAVDFGWFYFLTKPFFYVLDYFYNLLGNFGLAILLMTVCVKLLFFPLANKSYKAMSKMKALQPEMTRLREKYGDDRQKLNQEMMALYKTQKVNPASGCLPIVIQIPVFFSLYKVLFVTIEMRHAPFYGWIHDLSAPDPMLILTAFGHFPWNVPHFLAIGIWPLLMGCSMFLQQRLNPQPADPVQAKVFMFMPIFFTFLLGSFPAGLVIYWTWNNLLSMTQQFVIMKRMGVPIGRKT
jgi:YidC/Oxa1 family membrane protein insertase